MMTARVVCFLSSENMKEEPSGTIDLVVTSPPYPMVEMWDPLFSKLNPEMADALANHDGNEAFCLMHHKLDKSWAEVGRTLKSGGIVCVDIGDAVRTVGTLTTLTELRSSREVGSIGMAHSPTKLPCDACTRRLMDAKTGE